MRPDLDHLFRTERDRLLALGVHLTGDAALAEDAVQETFLLAHRFGGAFRGESEASTWLYRIAIRVCSRLRERTRKERRRAAGPRGPVSGDGRTEPSVPAEDRERWAVLKERMDALPDEQREALAMLTLRGLTAARIAEILGVPEGTVYSRAHAARAALRKVL